MRIYVCVKQVPDTAASQNGANEIFALVLEDIAGCHKETLQAYGANKIVIISVSGADPALNPEIKARAIAGAINNLKLETRLSPTVEVDTFPVSQYKTRRQPASFH